jgi:hypothetical protein
MTGGFSASENESIKSLPRNTGYSLFLREKGIGYKGYRIYGRFPPLKKGDVMTVFRHDRGIFCI